MDFTNKKVLIAFFSKKGENWYKDGLKDLAKGNTEVFAEDIQKATKGDIFEIIPAKAYPNGYDECCKVAGTEFKSKARPALAKHLDATPYDVVFVGWPCWWGTMPMAVYTWFEENKSLKGKIVIPFETNEGSGWGRGEKDIKAALPEASVLEGLQLRGFKVSESQNVIEKWLQSL